MTTIRRRVAAAWLTPLVLVAACAPVVAPLPLGAQLDAAHLERHEPDHGPRRLEPWSAHHDTRSRHAHHAHHKAHARTSSDAGSGCNRTSCLACLRKCWAKAPPGSLAYSQASLVRAVRHALTQHAGAGRNVTAAVKPSRFCSTPAETSPLLEAILDAARTRPLYANIGAVWGVGLLSWTKGLWMAWYACPRSLTNPGRCFSASAEPGHGQILAQCAAWAGKCAYDDRTLQSRGALTGGECRRVPPKPAARARGRRLREPGQSGRDEVPGRAPSPPRARRRRRRLGLSAALQGLSAAFHTSKASAAQRASLPEAARADADAWLRHRPWQCAAMRASFPGLVPGGFVAEQASAEALARRNQPSWVVYAQRMTGRPTIAHVGAAQPLAYSFRSPLDQARPSARPQPEVLRLNVSAYALVDLASDRACWHERCKSCSACRTRAGGTALLSRACEVNAPPEDWTSCPPGGSETSAARRCLREGVRRRAGRW